MQLVAYGAQDIYLTGNPQITFFKVVYRRHTNFSMETIEQTISGASSIAATTGSGTVTISRNGDLVSSVYVTSSSTGIQQGSHIVNEVELEIGGQRIDRHYEEWNDIWYELTTPSSKSLALRCMIGDKGKTGGSDDEAGVGLVQIPLQFWFCRNPGLALPLIALQYHEVKLKITWGISGDVGTTAECQVWADYIYLDTDERRRFAQVSHEYLIEQVQKQSASASTSQKLNFNHPVKELIWTGGSYTTAKLTLNGHDRFASQEEEYFQLRQPYQYHTAVPNQNLPESASLSTYRSYVNVFSGTHNDQAASKEAEDFSDAAVSANKIIVSKGGTGANLSAKTASVTTAAAQKAEETIYSVVASELGYIFKANQLFKATVDGTDTKTGADGTSATITGHVTAVHNGALAGGLTDAANFHFQLSETLHLPTIAAEIDAAAHFALTDLKVLRTTAVTSKMVNNINVYSFALKPEEHQPSGTCNFSRIDSARLETGAALAATDNIYAVNYNVLRIMSGMGGLAYSN